MSQSTLPAAGPIVPPSATALLQRFLAGLKTEPASPPTPLPAPADVRSVAVLLRGLPPGLDEAEAAGRIARAVLHAAGDVSFAAVVEQAEGCAPQPRWDGKGGRLWYGGVMVKRFRRDAANQEAILAAFEAQGWPLFIADPLPRYAGLDAPARLRETVRGLNRRLAAETIRFRSGGPADGVRWGVVA